jgi:hypothetical protein
MTTIVQKVLWHKKARAREQVMILRLIDNYGPGSFDATLEEIGGIVGMKMGTLCASLRCARDLGWITWERQYGDGTHNLRFVCGCRYTIKLKKG